MQEQPTQGLGWRYIVFVIFSLAIVLGNAYVMQIFYPHKPGAGKVAQNTEKAADKAQSGAKQQDGKKTAPAEGAGSSAKVATPEANKEGKADVKGQPAAKPGVSPAKSEATEPKIPENWVTLGSIDPASPYRMLVTFTNRGAAVRRIELSSLRFRDLEDRSGYLGHLVMNEAARGAGCLVQVVGRGTPAEQAGLRAGDRIKALGDQPVTGVVSLTDALSKTRPGQTVQLKVDRDGKEQILSPTLQRCPLEVVRPEDGAPPSFLVGLAQIDDQTLAQTQDAASGDNAVVLANAEGNVDRELDGAHLRDVNWEIVSQNESEVKFRRVLPRWGLEVIKTFRLAKVKPEDEKRADAPDYHLTFDLDVRNTGKGARKLAYYVDGPNGLPTEGWWYANKVSRDWGGAGLRDVVVSFQGDTRRDHGNQDQRRQIGTASA